MGCYGHSRLREIVLGGTTKSVLRSTHLPLLMAH
jgi:nucleotide-binding universal stress UspA family protein